MKNFLYKKETFIYQKEKSITDELCNDIIDIYNDDTLNISDKYNINENMRYLKIKDFLIKELKESLIKYDKQINKLKNYKFLYLNPQQFDFYIENNKTISENTKKINRFSENKLKLLMYIWFLNDYHGEISFWNEYKIQPKIGKILIFPVSWCFPYEEIIHLQANKYIIYGYVYE
jgi:hypothetical protein